MVKITNTSNVTLTPPSTIGTIADIAVSDSATQLATNNAKQVIIKNIGAVDVRIGDSNITATRGQELKPNDTIILDINNTDKIYHRTEAGASTINVTFLN